MSPLAPSRAPGPWLVAALFAICASVWSVIVPPFESPDETGHARYVNFLASQRRLPDGGREARGEAHQPPLYYALAAGIAVATGLPGIPVSPRRNASFHWYGGDDENKYQHSDDERPALSGSHRTLHRLRLLSVLLACGTVLLIHRLARLALDPPAALGATACAAFIPQFTFISASLNNDNLANLLTAAALVVLATGLEARGRGPWWCAGALTGAAVLAKFTGLFLYPCAAIALLLAARAARRSGAPFAPIRAAGAFLLPAVILPMPLWIRNTMVWGDPIGAGIQAAWLPNLVDRKAILSEYFLREFPVVLFESFWGRFGWMSFRLPTALYLAAGAVVVGGVAGLVVMARARELRPVHLLLVSACVIQIAQVVAFNTTYTQAQGRFLFPVLGPLAVLGCAGGIRVARALGAPAPGMRAARGAVLLLAAANLVVLQWIVLPGYQGPG